jgi:hypothetical protein
MLFVPSDDEVVGFKARSAPERAQRAEQSNGARDQVLR